MNPITIKLAYLIDLGETVSLFGFDPVSGLPTTIHVDHRPWHDAVKAARVGASKAYLARGLIVWLNIDNASAAETVQ